MTPETTDLRVRPATATDAAALGAVHVRAWRDSYRGIKPDDYLDGLSVEDRQGWWRATLADPPARYTAILVAEGATGIVGFAVVGPSGREPAGRLGELFMLNVDPAAWGTGAGRALLEAATAALARAGFAEAVLWVAPGNTRARRFYGRAGWSPDGTEIDAVIFGAAVHDIGYRRRLA